MYLNDWAFLISELDPAILIVKFLNIIGSNSIYEGSDSNLYLGDNSKSINNEI